MQQQRRKQQDFDLASVQNGGVYPCPPCCCHPERVSASSLLSHLLLVQLDILCFKYFATASFSSSSHPLSPPIVAIAVALPPKRQSTFPLAVSGFRYCFHAAIAIAVCLSLHCVANEYGEVRLESQENIFKKIVKKILLDEVSFNCLSAQIL